MPFPLPWFDNKPDPLLPQPQNIKPLLYALDDYQTYDLLWYIPVQTWFWIYSLRDLGVNLPVARPTPESSTSDFFENFTSIDKPVGWTFFERFTPWDYPWAEEYSTKFFNFVKQYCIQSYETWEVSFDYLDYAFDFKYLPNLPVLQPLIFDGYKAIQKFSFSVTTTESQTIVLTWLELQGLGSERDPVPTIISWLDFRIGEVNKRYRIINLQKGNNEITLWFPGYFCACSMVASGEKDVTAIEAAIDNNNPGILYKNLDKLFSEISERIWFKGKITISESGSNTLVDTPNWAYYAKLIYANNNHWGNQITIDITKDLGKPIFFTPVYQNGSIVDLICHLWGNYLYSVYRGKLDIYWPGTLQEIRSNLYKVNFLNANSYQTSLFNESEQEGLNRQLENFLITQGVALPPNVVIDFLDAKKKLELQDA